MKDKSRIKLEVGSYNKPDHYAVIGEPTVFYIWYKPKGQKGSHSKWMSGHEAYRHYMKMREILTINKNQDGFVSYLSDLYHENIELKKVA